MLEGIRRMAVQISARTGLKEETCVDLLMSGWGYSQKEGEADKWASPNVSPVLPKGIHDHGTKAGRSFAAVPGIHKNPKHV